jgi:hypothetical protein
MSRDVRLTGVYEILYKELLNTKIRRLIVDFSLIQRMDKLSFKYGKLNCEMCTIVISYTHIGYILLNFVNTEIIDVCGDHQLNSSSTYFIGVKIPKFTTNTEAKLYIGCKPFNKHAITFTRLNNGGILDQDDKLVKITEIFAKSAKK